MPELAIRPCTIEELYCFPIIEQRNMVSVNLISEKLAKRTSTPLNQNSEKKIRSIVIPSLIIVGSIAIVIVLAHNYHRKKQKR